MEREIQKIVLPNGLRILLERDERMRSCSMGVWIKSGSGYEKAAHSGVSHFIEHMLFKGTPTRSATDIAQQMDAIGGVLNAYTAKEYTCVYARALTDHVERAFSVIADMVTSPRMDEEDMETEKGIIAEEIAMYEDSPEDLCMDLFYEAVWPQNAFGRNILGSRETVEAMCTQTLRRHMRQFYTPRRMVVSFCGNFDEDIVLRLCETYFSVSAENADAEDTREEGTPRYQTAIRLFEKDAEQNQLVLGFPGVAADDGRKYAVQLFSSLLGASSSSRLFRRIREDLGLVYSIESFHVPHLNAGLFGIAMGVSPQAQAQALQETLRVLRGFDGTVSEQELSRAKEQAVASMIMGFESSATRVSHAGRSELLHGRILSEDEIIRRIRGVSLADIHGAAQLLTDTSALSLCAVGHVEKQTFYEELMRGE